MQLASCQDDFLNAQSTNKQLSDQISLLETQLQKVCQYHIYTCIIVVTIATR